jgi:hypothetical protein
MSEESTTLDETGGLTVAKGDLESLLAAMLEQARALAARLAGNPDHETSCHFCNGPLPLWENLLVLQLTGVAAHVECPAAALQARLDEVGPQRGFPYEDFCRAVEQRLDREAPVACSGTIEI